MVLKTIFEAFRTTDVIFSAVLGRICEAYGSNEMEMGRSQILLRQMAVTDSDTGAHAIRLILSGDLAMRMIHPEGCVDPTYVSFVYELQLVQNELDHRFVKNSIRVTGELRLKGILITPMQYIWERFDPELKVQSLDTILNDQQMDGDLLFDFHRLKEERFVQTISLPAHRDKLNEFLAKR
jgi:hypothetical protein